MAALVSFQLDVEQVCRLVAAGEMCQIFVLRHVAMACLDAGTHRVQLWLCINV